MKRENTEAVRTSLIKQLNSSLCASCTLTNRTVTDATLRCHVTENRAIFRARIIGSDVYSASGLVDLLQSWVRVGTASVNVGSLSYSVDPHCSVVLDSPFGPDCTSMQPTTAATTPERSYDTTTTSSSSEATSSVSVNNLGQRQSISSGAVGGLVVGLVIMLLLVMFIVLLAILLYRSFRGTVG